MYAIYGHMDPINIPTMLAYIPAPWILWVDICQNMITSCIVPPRHLQISWSTRGPPRSMSRRGPPIRHLRDSHHHLGSASPLGWGSQSLKSPR